MANLLLPYWSTNPTDDGRRAAKGRAVAQVTKDIFRAAAKRPSRACRQLLPFLLSYEAASLGKVLAEHIESYQVRDLTKGLVAMAESEGQWMSPSTLDGFRSFMTVPPGDQLLAMVGLRNILEQWTMSLSGLGEPDLDLRAFQEELRAYFIPQQWPKKRTRTPKNMYRFARDVHGRDNSEDTSGFLGVMAWLLKSARAGHADAETAVGYYFVECGDLRRYTYWTRKAARQGSALALFNLGLSSSCDEEAPPSSYRTALRYLLKANRLGHPPAKGEIGHVYIKLRIYARAKRWLEHALLVSRDEYALHNLGYLYEHGLGVSPSKHSAIVYYEEAANYGLEASKKAIGRLESEARG